MKVQLVVVRPFEGLAKGDIVTDEERIAAILRGDHAPDVVRVTVPSR
jgi:hypothetical protein